MGIREYLLNGPLGFGAAPLGNMFRNIRGADADATVEAAWSSGTLQRLMPACESKRVDIVVGGPYSTGVLAGGANFEYAPASAEIMAKVQRIKKVCERFAVSIKAAALHFSLAHPASAAVIPGASRPERIVEDHSAMNERIPVDFWRALRKEELVSPMAPLPIDRT